MVRGFVALLAVSLLPAPAAAPAQYVVPVPDTVTPDGPATVSSVWRGAYTAIGSEPQVLTGVSIVVGPGGRGGPIRLRVSSTIDPERGTQLGPWVDLPATPGTYTFAAPPLHWEYPGGVIAIDQQVGGHAIVSTSGCLPDLGPGGDPCQLIALDVFHGLADTDPAIGTATTPDERHPGRQLTAYPVSAPDLDGDRVPDSQEPRDLQLQATRGFSPTGASVLRVTVHNAGPAVASLPVLTSDLPPTLAPEAWRPACLPDPTYPISGPAIVAAPLAGAHCLLASLAAGASDTVVVTLPAAYDARPVTVSIVGAGPDANPVDDTATVAPPALVELPLPAPQRAGRGLRLVVRTHRVGRLRVSAVAGGAFSARTVRVARPGRVVVTLPLRLGRRHAPVATIHATLTTWGGAISVARQRVALAR